MNDKTVNRIAFWLLAMLPVWGLFIVMDVFGSFWFAAFLMVYVLIYRPILHIFRLLQLKKIDERDAWKFFIPFYHNKYIRTIWFG
jgi:hypothetical protein